MNALYNEAKRLGLNTASIISSRSKPSYDETVRAFARLLGFADYGGTNLKLTHRYRFYLFHFDAIAAFRSTANTILVHAGAYNALLAPYAERSNAARDRTEAAHWVQLDEPEAHDKRRIKAEKAAFRLMHVLGLDFALVEVGVTPQERPVLLALEPFPPMDNAMGDVFARSLARYRERPQQAADDGSGQAALLGADPEFVIVGADGRVVPASAYLPKRGIAGCDAVRLGERVVYPLAELRPSPSADPRRLVANIRRAMLSAAEQIPDKPELRWLAGSMPARGFALGGHIHFSGVALDIELLRVLDNYIALPLALVEGAQAKARRQRYGVPGDVRRKAHGGFEYRTPPSWLASPRAAKGVLGLAALAAKNARWLRRRPLADHAAMRAFLLGADEELRPLVLPLLDDIAAAPSYAEYESLIAPFLTMIQRGEQWDERQDIRIGWKIPASFVHSR